MRLITQAKESRRRRCAAFDVWRQARCFVFLVNVSEVSSYGPIMIRSRLKSVLESINARIRKIGSYQNRRRRKRNEDSTIRVLTDDRLIAEKLASGARR